MMLGARTGAWAASGGGWTNPYVTDGLIAMWDGEWNAGGGVHDATAIAPVDIVGGTNPAVPVTFYGETIADDMAFRMQSGAYVLGGIQPLSDWEGVTIELCHKMTKTSGTYNQNSFNIGWTYYGTGYKATARTGFMSGSGSRTTLYFVKGTYVTIPGNNTYPNHGSISYTIEHGSASIYTNGATLSYSATDKQVTPTAAFAFRNINGTAGTEEDSIYSIRIYNRALTAEEIAANYAIDKARFGLA